MNYGKILRELREEKDLTQQQLADKIGISQKAISFWETDKRTPNTDDYIKIADFFGVTLDYLVNREYKDTTYNTIIDQRHNQGTINNNIK